ncbi:MAG: glucose-1-phosphate cytidylyltransferase [Spirochaetota bacterium]
MKVVILAGGLGTRLSEETDMKPKPMVEIGGKPILWHIMKIYSSYGFNEFIICLGYKGYLIKEYFHHYYMHHTDVTVDLENNDIIYHNSKAESWKIILVDTGMNTMTGGRVKRIKDYTKNETFMVTYGDGLSDVDIKSLVEFHNKHKKYATVTAVQPSGRFGSLEIDTGGQIRSFVEKPAGDNAWINGGFFVFEPAVFDYLIGDETSLEREPLEKLVSDKQFMAYKHVGFWQPMDTLREKNMLEDLWKTDKAPWKIWK